MRIPRSPSESPDFDNLLAHAGVDEAGASQAFALPDPFGGTQLTIGPRDELPALQGNALPGPSLGPYRPSWRESTFLRAVGLGLDSCLAALGEWGQRSGQRGVVDLRHGRLVISPDVARGGDPGRCSIPVRLRRGAQWLVGAARLQGVPASAAMPWPLGVPMELELVPWPEIFATTWLVLIARRRVRLSRRYFRAGHALLDELTAGLLRHAELTAAS